MDMRLNKNHRAFLNSAFHDLDVVIDFSMSDDDFFDVYDCSKDTFKRDIEILRQGLLWK